MPMFERSDIKKRLLEELAKYERENLYALKKASAFQLAKDLDASENAVSQILRHLKYEGIVTKSSGGSWHLI